MKRHSGWLLMMAIVIAAMAGGFVLGRRSVSVPTHPPPTASGEPVFRATDSVPAQTGVVTAAAPEVSAPPQRSLEESLRSVLSSPSSRRWTKLILVAHSLSESEMMPALELAEAILPRGEFMNFRYQVYDRWAELDPSGLLAHGEALANRRDRDQAVSAAVLGWATRDGLAALAWVEAQPPGSRQQQLKASVLQGIAASDPARALALLNEAPVYQRRWIRNQIIDSLAESDPRSAADMAVGQSQDSVYGGMTGAALGGVLRKWMQQDPDAAVAWMASQPEAVLRRRTIVQGVSQIAWDYPEEAMRLVELVPASQSREDALSGVLNSWGQKDPEALKTWLDQCTDPVERTIGQLAYAGGLAATDPAAAALSLQDLSVTPQQAHSFNSVFSEYAQRDPQGAVSAAMAVKDPLARRTAMTGAINGWAQADPGAAAAYAAGLPSGPGRTDAVSAAASVWASRDPQAALGWLQQLPNPVVQKEAIQRVMWQLTSTDPREAANYVGVLPSGQDRVDLTARVAEQWAGSRFDEALAWVQSLPQGRAQTAAYERIAGQWIGYDLPGAAQFAKDLPAGQLKSRMLNELAGNWAWRDPEAAMRFAEDLPADTSRQEFTQRIIGGWAARDPERAAQYAMTLSAGYGRDELLQQIAGSWGGSDPTSALNWANTMPAGDGRSAALSGVLRSWASTAPEQAADYVLRLSGDELERGVSAVINGMVQSDPAYTATWIQDFPEGRMREQAGESLMRVWAGQDPQAASDWLADLPEGTTQQKAAEQFVERAASHDPELAWGWALMLNDPTKQREALKHASGPWLKANDAVAREVILNSGLPEDLVLDLLRPDP